MHAIVPRLIGKENDSLKNKTLSFLQIALSIISCLWMFLPSTATSEDFYAACVKSYQFTDDEVDIFALTPVNDICHHRCLIECSAFSRKASLPKDPQLKARSSEIIDEGTELNQDVIDECMTQCQNGVKFSSTFRISEAHSYEQCKRETVVQCLNIQNSGPVSIGAACFDTRLECPTEDIKQPTPCQQQVCGPIGYKSGWTKDNSYQTSIFIRANKLSKVIVDLLSGQGAQGGNTVYLCGHKKIRLDPIFPNIHASDYSALMTDWTNTATPPKAWPSAKDHECFVTEGNPCASSFAPMLNYPSSSNKMLWGIANNDKCGWHARNPCYTNTGIYPMDGDALAISWKGNYAFDSSGGNRYMDRYLALDCLTDPTSSDKAAEECRKRWNEATKLLLKISDKKITLEGEGMRTTNLIQGIADNHNPPSKDALKPGEYGFIAKMNPENVRYECNAKEKECNCSSLDDSTLNNPKCITFLNKGTGSYSYSGTLNGFSSKRDQLQIKHYYPSQLKCAAQDPDADAILLFNIVDILVLSVTNMRDTCMKMGAWGRLSTTWDSTDDKLTYITDYNCGSMGIDLLVENHDLFMQKYMDKINPWVQSLGTIGSQSPSKVETFLQNAPAVKQAIAGGSLSEYQNSIGGFEVELDWKGCPFHKGERLQYAIAPDKSNFKKDGIPEGAWHDLPAKIFQPNSADKPADKDPNNVLSIKSHTEGFLFFRIKTLEAPADASDEIQELYTKPGHWTGQYNISVQRATASNVLFANGFIKNLLNGFITTLFGSDKEDGDTHPISARESGVVYKIYTGVVKNQLFINLIRAFLALYIAFTGVGFVLGFVAMHQKELLSRLIKVAVVITLISPGSWQFFGGYIVPLFVRGTIELISAFASINAFGDQITSYEELKKDPLNLFAIFDGPIKIMFSAATWKKIVGLLFSGISGIMLVIAIIVGIVMYMITIVKVVLMFVLALVMLSLLLILTPVCLPCIFFSQTKSVFDNWWKGLISHSLQPIAVFATVSLFNIPIITIFQLTMGFTVCETCYLYVDLGFYKACWLPGYIQLIIKHMPDTINSGFLMPPGVVSRALAFLLLTNGAMILCARIAQIINNIVMGNPVMAENSKMAEAGMEMVQSHAIGAFSTASATTSGALRTLARGMQKLKPDKKEDDKDKEKKSDDKDKIKR